MISTRTLPIALTALVVAIGGAGCGGDDDTVSTSGASGATGVSATGDVAADAEAKAFALEAQVALEVYATEHGGSYAGADDSVLAQIEPDLALADVTVTGDKTTYTIEVASSSGVTFSVAGGANGEDERTCEPAGTGGCPETGDWS